MSVIATAFSPPESEYARENNAKKIKPFSTLISVNALMDNEPSHKTLVRFIKI